jgi:hypothetical protein
VVRTKGTASEGCVSKKLEIGDSERYPSIQKALDDTLKKDFTRHLVES